MALIAVTFQMESLFSVVFYHYFLHRLLFVFETGQQKERFVGRKKVAKSPVWPLGLCLDTGGPWPWIKGGSLVIPFLRAPLLSRQATVI